MHGESSGPSGREPRDRGEDERRRSGQQVAHLFRISAQLLVAQDLDEQLRLVARGIVIACNYRRCVITLFDEDWNVWKLAYAGLTVEEIAQVLEVSTPTVKRDLKSARVWLFHTLRRDLGSRTEDDGKPDSE